MKKFITISYAVGFLLGYVLFVHVNARYIQGWGCWNDLNWLGVESNQLVPGISMLMFAAFQDPPYILFNLLVIGVAGWCELNLLEVWGQTRLGKKWKEQDNKLREREHDGIHHHVKCECWRCLKHNKYN